LPDFPLTIHKFNISKNNAYIRVWDSMKRFCVFGFVLVLFCLVVGVGTAGAHANIARADPAPDSVVDAPPEVVIVWFTEPVEEQFSELLVFSADGSQVDNGDSRLLPDDLMAVVVTLRTDPPLEDGSYTVSWKNVSTVDGHIVRSSFVFSVGQAIETPAAGPAVEDTATAPQPLEPLIRWLVLLAIAGILGGLLFDLVVVRPSLVGKFSEFIGTAHEARLNGRILALVWVFMGLFLLGSVGQLLLQTFNVNGNISGEGLVTMLTAAYWGKVWLGRMVLFLVLVALLPLPGRFNPERPWGHSWERPREWLALAVVAAVMVTLSLVSHAAATAGVQVTAVVSDLLHLLAAGAWAGGLFHFAWNMPYFLRQFPENDRRGLLAAVVPRFSVLAIICVAVLILTGIFSSYVQVTVLAALDTMYGRTLLVKLALIVPLLLLGAVNLLWIGRRLRADGQAGLHLWRTVRAEVALVVLVLLAVGFLVTMEPARQAASRQQAEAAAAAERPLPVLEDSAEGITGRLIIDTAEPGEKQVVIELFGRNDAVLENASDVIMTLAYPAEELEPFIGPPTNPEPGRYVFEGVPFTLVGDWEAEFLVVRPDAFDTRLRYSVEIGGEQAAPAAVEVEMIEPDERTAVYLFVGMVLVLGVVAFGAVKKTGPKDDK
jgi:copper transport protein